jgi:hypothetical protein
MGPTIRQGTIDDLRELLQAIDRRLPRVTHADEPVIAREAAALREHAVVLLARLEALEIDGNLQTRVNQGHAGQTSGQHDQKDNRGSAGQEAESDVRNQPAVEGERLTKSGRQRRLG